MLIAVGGIVDPSGQQARKAFRNAQEDQVVPTRNVRSPQVLARFPGADHQQDGGNIVQVGTVMIAPGLRVSTDAAQHRTIKLDGIHEPVVDLAWVR